MYEHIAWQQLLVILLVLILTQSKSKNNRKSRSEKEIIMQILPFYYDCVCACACATNPQKIFPVNEKVKNILCMNKIFPEYKCLWLKIVGILVNVLKEMKTNCSMFDVVGVGAGRL